MNLRLKLLIPQLLVAAAMVAYIYMAWAPNSLQQAHDERLQLIERHLDTVEEGVVSALLGRRLDVIHENLSILLGKNTGWISIRVLDDRGREIYPGALRQTDPPQSRGYAHIDKVERAITYIGAALGTMIVEVDDGPKVLQDRERIGNLARLILGLLGAMLLISTLALELMVRRPLSRLAVASSALARQDFAAPLPRAGRDEVGSLVRAFGAMRDSLNTFQAEVLREVTERKLAEESLRERETMYRSLVAAMTEGVVFSDASGAVTAINPAAGQLFAGNEADLQEIASAWPNMEFLRPDGRPLPRESHPTCITLHTGQPQNDVVLGLQRPNGATTWISVNSQPLTKDGATAPYAAVTTVHDITVVKQAEEERQEHLHFFECLDRVNRAIQGASSIDEMMSDVLGVALGVFHCDRAALVFPLDPDAPVWKVAMQRERQGPTVAGREIAHNAMMERDFRYMLANGGPLKVCPNGDLKMLADAEIDAAGIKSVLAMPLHPKTGKPWAFALMQRSYERDWTKAEARLFREIARRVTDSLSSLLVQRDLRENEHKYREIFSNVSDSLLLFDVTGEGRFRLADLNPSAEKILGVAKESATGKYFEDLTTADGREQSLPLFQQCVEQRQRFAYEHQIELGGGFRDLNTVLVPVRDRKGAVYRLIVLNRDVTEIKTAERHFRTLVENLPDQIWRLDAKGCFTYVSPAITTAFGAPYNDLIGKTARELFPAAEESTLKQILDSVQQAFTSAANSSAEVQLPMPDGVRTAEIRFVPELDRNGNVMSVLGISRDVSERIQMMASLRQLSAAVEQSPVGVLITDVNGIIQYVNPAFCNNSLYSADEVIGKNPRFLQDDARDRKDIEALWSTIRRGKSWHGTFRNMRKDGTRHWEEAIIAPIRDARGKITQFVGIQQDITARKKAEEKVEFLAHHDALTGLPNRLLAKDRMEMAMSVAERLNSKVALMFLDLDGFKRVNDTLGHHVGDQLLSEISNRLQRIVRRTDTVARQGGDEFLIILANVRDAESMAAAATSTIECINKPMTINAHELSVSASVGIAIYPDDGKDWDTIFKKADVAMYSAKESGRGTYRFFTETMNAYSEEYLLLQNNLQHALARNEFVLHYQPQIDLRSGQVTGVEALLRWDNPDLGLVQPKRFISIAEDSGLIVAIGEWVLNEACRQAAEWKRAGLPRVEMAVNLSAVQFRSGKLLRSVHKALADSGLQPADLELEMTESILIEDTANVLSTVQDLKSMGVKLSIDDFGTGYSSLSYLKRFNADKVKIDQSFVRDIANDNNSDVIVGTIVHMARGLGLTTVAEGVESQRDLLALRHHNCDQAQGFYFAKPMSAGDVSAFLLQKRPHAAAG